MCVSVLNAHVKKESYPITDSYEPLYGCWDLNLGPVDEILDYVFFFINVFM